MKSFVAALLVAGAAARAPILRGHNVHDVDVIEDSYIVVFKHGAKVDFAMGMQSIKKAGIVPALEYNINDDFLGFNAKLDSTQLDFITNLPGVDYVEVDSRVYALNVPTCDSTQTGLPAGLWGLSAAAGRGNSGVYDYARNGGDGVDVYDMDTGVNCGHDEWSGDEDRCYNSWCAQASWCSPGDLNTDGNGHGTHVAGTMTGPTYGVAKGASMTYGVKVLSDLGFGSNAGVIGGVDHSAEHNNGGNGVGNMSLGGGANAALDQAMEAAKASGLAIAVASGNGGGANGACNGSPARSPAAFTVGATDVNNRMATFTDQGSCVDILAPGVNVLSSTGTGSGTSTYSGTSMASPHVAGYLTLLRGNNPSDNVDSILRLALDNARDGLIDGVNSATPNTFLTTC